MPTHDLRSFLAQLEHTGDLRRVAEPVSPHLEMTALCDRVLRAGGPALLFENPTGHRMPVLANLFPESVTPIAADLESHRIHLHKGRFPVLAPDLSFNA